MAPRKQVVAAVENVVELVEDNSSDEEVVVPVKATKASKSKASKKVIDTSSDDSSDESSNTKVTKTKKKAVVVTDDSSDEASDDSTKVKATRKSLSLEVVLAALEKGDVKVAKTKLTKFIEKYGAEGVKRKSRKAADKEDKPKTAYQQFFSDELKKLAEEENKKDKEDRMSPKDRMRAVAAMWKAKKQDS
jgi:hypothetical protein